MRKVALLPSLFTTGNIVCGMMAIVNALHGRYDTAAFLLVLALVCDALDGNVARITHTSSAFGLNFDSLADLISFGLAPAMMLYLKLFEPTHEPGGVTLLVCYTLCTALRLARFNVQAAGKTKKEDFVGLPCPMAATLLIAMVLCLRVPSVNPPSALALSLGVYKVSLPSVLVRDVALVLGLICSVLMVSNLPYPSLNRIGLLRRSPFQHLAVVALAAGLVVLWPPQLVLLVGAFVYIMYAPLRALRREPLGGTAEETEDSDDSDLKPTSEGWGRP